VPAYSKILRQSQIGYFMYERTVPHLLHGLKSLDALLVKAEAHCETRKIEPDALLAFRLYPDMFAFVRQVQLVTDFAKGCAARLSGTTVPSFEDSEKSFPDLHARVAKTVAFLEGIEASKFNGAEKKSVTVRIGRNEEVQMVGDMYYNRVVLPNFYFHLATAYNILRHNGVELGKGDFVGRSI
jgi:uncharacterized protein